MADEQAKSDERYVYNIGNFDRQLRFEKHASKPGKAGAPKQPFTRPWGSQPQNADLKTGVTKGAPHPVQKADLKQVFGR